MIEKASTDIFWSNAQIMPDGFRVEDIRPRGDMVLVKDVPDDEQIGSIFVPQGVEVGAGKNGLVRIGIVIAVGPGDKYFEKWDNKIQDVVRKAYRCKCLCHEYGEMEGWLESQCTCHGTGFAPVGTIVKVGDRVLYDRRKEGELFVNGARYVICHEQQAIFAIIEP